MSNKPIVLVVDDVELNRAFLYDMLESDYTVLEAENGKVAIELMQQHQLQIDVIMLDVVMPVMDGFEVLAYMNKKGWIENIPVIMISAETSADYINNGYELGVVDYISRPFDSNIIKHRLKNTIMLYAKQRALQQIVKEQIREKEKNNTLMVDILSSIVEFRNGESGMHVLRIRIITEILLEALVERYPNYCLSSSEIAMISNAAALHDIGKVAIDEKILNKPGRLTPEEYEQVKKHAELGAEMLKQMRIAQEESLVQYAHDICRWHHERWDGKGYPDGLVGNAIPISAQVVSLADVYDALVSERVYKPAYSHGQAMQMIINGECGSFNPELIDCLISVGNSLNRRIYIKSDKRTNLFDLEKLSKEAMERHQDILPSQRTLQLLEQERIKYQFLAALSNEILFEYSTKTEILAFSERGYTELNLEPSIDCMNQNYRYIHILSEEDNIDLWNGIFSTTSEQPFFQKQYLVDTPKGKCWYEFIVRTLWSNDLNNICLGFVGKLSNIHEQKIEASLLREMAEHDSLTKLYNRVAMHRLINESLHKGVGCTLLFFDLDNFKLANDTYGHAFGDDLLVHVADLISNHIRQGDLAARLGGDEFLVFLEGLYKKEDAYRKAESLCKLLCKNFGGFALSVSIGGVIFPQDGMEYDELIQKADEALYLAKRKGKAQVCFYGE